MTVAKLGAVQTLAGVLGQVVSHHVETEVEVGWRKCHHVPEFSPVQERSRWREYTRYVCGHSLHVPGPVCAAQLLSVCLSVSWPSHLYHSYTISGVNIPPPLIRLLPVFLLQLPAPGDTA